MGYSYGFKLFGGGGTGGGVGTSLTTEVLFNNAGVVDGDPGLTYDAGTDTLTSTGTVVARNLTATGLATPVITPPVSPVLSLLTTVTVVAGASLTDGDYFTLSDGSAVVYEFDNDATVTPGRVGITFVGTETAQEIRDLVIVAINGSTLQATAIAAAADTLTVTSDVAGDTMGVNSENVANAGFLVPVWGEPTHATTYGYKVVAFLPDGTSTAASAEVQTVLGHATLSNANYNAVTWGAVTGASSYRLYRTTGTPAGGDAPPRLLYTGPLVNFSDTNAASTSETPATVDGTGVLKGDGLSVDGGSLAYDPVADTLGVAGKLGVGVTGAPVANLEVWGTSYVYTLTAAATGSAVQFDSILNKASTVYGVYTNTVHNSSTGDAYGIIANVAKSTGRAGQVIGVEGYVTAPHQADDSRHYGLIGDNRAPANGKTGTVNIGSWNIAYLADTNIATLISDVPHGALPASGNYAIYSGDTGYTTHLAGPVVLPNLPVYADNTAALAGGLTAGRVYRTATGVVMIVYTP